MLDSSTRGVVYWNGQNKAGCPEARKQSPMGHLEEIPEVAVHLMQPKQTSRSCTTTGGSEAVWAFAQWT